MKDEEGAGHRILFHQVLTFQNFAKLKLVKKQLSKFFIFNEVGEGEMVFETLEDECFVAGCLFLNNFHKVLVYLVVIDGAKSSKFLGLSFGLGRWRNTSS